MNRQQTLTVSQFMNLAFDQTSNSEHISYNDWSAVRDSLVDAFKDTYGDSRAFSATEIAANLGQFAVAARGTLEMYVDQPEANAIAQRISRDLRAAVFN